MPSRGIAIPIVFVAVVASCTDEGTGSPSSSSPATGVGAGRPVVIDTDVGSDDIVAILYLLQHPDVRIEAITVVGTGLAHCEPGLRNVLAHLEAAGAPDIPVSCGRQTPLPLRSSARRLPGELAERHRSRLQDPPAADRSRA